MPGYHVMIIEFVLPYSHAPDRIVFFVSSSYLGNAGRSILVVVTSEEKLTGFFRCGRHRANYVLGIVTRGQFDRPVVPTDNAPLQGSLPASRTSIAPRIVVGLFGSAGAHDAPFHHKPLRRAAGWKISTFLSVHTIPFRSCAGARQPPEMVGHESEGVTWKLRSRDWPVVKAPVRVERRVSETLNSACSRRLRNCEPVPFPIGPSTFTLSFPLILFVDGHYGRRFQLDILGLNIEVRKEAEISAYRLAHS
ncbi:hypothetical protein EI94DRAFT_1340411 [Lactarius quietus]|nr:hypothetical protein EI94DRAFT_1340411 [Lactarius quietus]